jgi:16S rRNA C1402 N4-methylase RsmH
VTLTFDSEEDKIYKAAITKTTNAEKVRELVAAHPLEAAKLIVKPPRRPRQTPTNVSISSAPPFRSALLKSIFMLTLCVKGSRKTIV